eukprot:403335783
MNPQQPSQSEKIKLKIQKILNVLFPDFQLKSFTCVFVAIQLFVYVIARIVFLENRKSPKNYVSWDCTLYNMGAKFTYAIQKQYQFHRLILPIFFHCDSFTLIWNLLAQLMFGFYLEQLFMTRHLNKNDELQQSQSNAQSKCALVLLKLKYCVIILSSMILSNMFSAAINAENFGCAGTTVMFVTVSSLFLQQIEKFMILKQNDSGQITVKKLLNLSIKMSIKSLLVVGFMINNFFYMDSDVDKWANLGGYLNGIILYIIFIRDYDYVELKVTEEITMKNISGSKKGYEKFENQKQSENNELDAHTIDSNQVSPTKDQSKIGSTNGRIFEDSPVKSLSQHQNSDDKNIEKDDQIQEVTINLDQMRIPQPQQQVATLKQEKLHILQKIGISLAILEFVILIIIIFTRQIDSCDLTKSGSIDCSKICETM